MDGVQGDVIEALRLMECSKLSLHEEGDERQTQDNMSAIYSKIRDALLRSPSGLSWTDIRQHTSSFEVHNSRPDVQSQGTDMIFVGIMSGLLLQTPLHFASALQPVAIAIASEICFAFDQEQTCKNAMRKPIEMGIFVPQRPTSRPLVFSDAHMIWPAGGSEPAWSLSEASVAVC